MEKKDSVLFQARYEYFITPKKITPRIRAQKRYKILRCLILKVVQLYDSHIWWKMWSAIGIFITVSHPQTSWSILARKVEEMAMSVSLQGDLQGRTHSQRSHCQGHMPCASLELQAVSWSKYPLASTGRGGRVATEQPGPHGLTAQGVFCSPLYMGQSKRAKQHGS